MNNREQFLQILRNEFAPRLREIGFKGNERNFKRVDNEIINVINLQANKYGGSYVVNLGLHLTFLPTGMSSELLDVDKIKAHECEFYMRLAPGCKNEHWWKYKGLFCNPSKNARHLIETYFKHGEGNFKDFKSIDDFINIFSIEKLKKDKYANNFREKGVLRGSLTMARIYEHLGQTENAKIFAKLGLENLGRHTQLKPEFEKIIGH